MIKVVIDHKIRHGKPIVEGTRITVEEVLEMLQNGMTFEEIKNEYGLNKQQVLAALRYATSILRGEEVYEISA